MSANRALALGARSSIVGWGFFFQAADDPSGSPYARYWAKSQLAGLFRVPERIPSGPPLPIIAAVFALASAGEGRAFVSPADKHGGFLYPRKKPHVTPGGRPASRFT